MANAVTPIPEGRHSITTHLTVNGASDYMDFLQRAFGAVEIMRAPGPGGKLMHVSARIGDSVVMFNDVFPELRAQPIAPGPWPFVLHLYVSDADATFTQAVAAGCQVVLPMADQFWGSRYGQVKDPAGFVWSIATHKENLTPEETRKRQDALFGKEQPA